MPAFTDQCYDCGVEYVPLIVEGCRCPDCGSPATPLVGAPTVLDVRPLATLDADDFPEPEGIEVLVRDGTDRLVVYEFAVPRTGRPYAVEVTFGEATIRRGDEHWSAIDGPDRVATAIEARIGVRPGPAPDAAVR